MSNKKPKTPIKPPSRLPNGKTNPEYTKWYRNTPQGMASTKKWNSQSGAAAMRKYRSTEKASLVAAQRIKKEIDSGKRIKTDQCKCVECGMVFDRLIASIDGFRFLDRNRFMGICNYCE